MSGWGILLFNGQSMTQTVPSLFVPLQANLRGNDLLVPPKKLEFQEHAARQELDFLAWKKRSKAVFSLLDTECLIGDDPETQVPKSLSGCSSLCQIHRGLYSLR